MGNFILSTGPKVIVLCVLSCADLRVRECGAAGLGRHGVCASGMISSRYLGTLWCRTKFFKTGLPSKIVLYKWNFLLLVSISRGLWTHSYSPYLESKVPFCRDRNFKVKRGPSS